MSIAIFLNIDGVIHSSSRYDYPDMVAELYDTCVMSGEQFGRKCDEMAVKSFDESSVSRLDTLISQIQERSHVPIIVLSSGWRTKGDIQHLVSLFKQWNFSRYLVDKIDDESGKVEGILKWLDVNRESRDVRASIVLDDDDFREKLAPDSCNHHIHYVECDYRKMFAEDRLVDAVQFLDTLQIQQQ